MDRNVYRRGSPPREPDSYWRRRVFVLGGAFGLLGLVAWACSAAIGGPRSPQSAAAATSPTTQQAADSVATTSAASVTPTARPARTPHVTVQAQRPSHACAPRDVIISLFVSQQTYQRATKPQFEIYVVNTGRRACAFDAGPRSLRLVIKSGPLQSWSTADCTHGAATRMVRLLHSVPFVTYVKWNRERSSPGCPSPRTGAPPGTYTATAISDADHSPAEAFVLR